MARPRTITLETTSLLILQGQAAECVWCPQCAAESELIPLRTIGVVSNLDQKALEGWLNSGEIHRQNSRDGSPAICLNSLLARVWKTGTR